MTTPVFETNDDDETVMNATVAEALEAAWENHITSTIAHEGECLKEAMQEQIEEHLVAMASAAEETLNEKVDQQIAWLDEKLDEYLSEHLVEEINRIQQENELLHTAIRILVEDTYKGGDIDAFYAQVRAEVASHIATADSYQDEVISKSKGDAASNRASLRPGQGTSAGTQSTAIHEDGGVKFTNGQDLENFAEVIAHQAGAEVLVEDDGNVLLEGVSPDDRIAKKQVRDALAMTRYLQHADQKI
jgi:hypothetical protein